MRTSARPRYTAETHSYDEIAEALNSAEAALAAAKAELNTAKRNAAATGRRLPVAEFCAKEERVTRLGRVAQILQRELAKARRKASTTKTSTLERHFMEVCREELDPTDMQEMLDEALRRTQKEMKQCSAI